MKDFSASLLKITPSSARELQLQLKSVERSQDDDLADLGELLAKTVRAAREAGVLPLRARRTYGMLIEAINRQQEAGDVLQRYHQDCRRLLKSLPLPELGWGDVGPSPGIEDGLAPTQGEVAAKAVSA